MKQRTTDNITGLLAGLLTCICLIMLVDEAGATNKKPPKLPEQEQEQWQQQDQLQEQMQDQNQSQTQDQSQNVEVTATTGDVSNSQVINFQSSDDVTIRNVASANPPSVFGSHPCAIGGSIGLGVPGANIGGGRQKVDPECEVRETARLLHALGERELAVMALCTTEAAQRTLGDACGPSVTQEELRRRIEFIMQEREIERQQCEDSKDRIAEGCGRK